MKNVLLLLSAILLSINVWSQSCLPQGITFSTQGQINNFATDFPNCTQIQGNVTIMGSNITSLNGLNMITSIGGYLWIQDNDSLTSLAGLNHLTSISGLIWIAINKSLVSLSGLDSVNELSITSLHILYNANLTTCGVKSICRFLALPLPNAEIHDNAPGCNSIAEEQTACASLSVEGKGYSHTFSIFPNPASDKLIIETSIPSSAQLAIFNLNGIRLIGSQISGVKSCLDIASLPVGIYYIRYTSGNTIEIQKFIKR